MDDPVLDVTDENLEAVVSAPRAMLILARSDCGHCAAYQAEIHSLVADDRLNGIVVGKLVLDRPGCLRFKRENHWLRDLHHLPYTLVFRDGVRVDEFATSKGSYLLGRLADLRQMTTAEDESAPLGRDEEATLVTATGHVRR